MKKREVSAKIYELIVVVLIVVFLGLVGTFVGMNSSERKTEIAGKQEVSENAQVEFFENQNPLDLDKIFEDNTSVEIKEEMITEEVDLDYNTKYKNNEDLPDGVVQVVDEGRVGRKNVITIKKYKNGELYEEQEVAQNIIKSPVDRVVEIGSGSKYKKYTLNVGDIVYVVSNSVAVRLQKDSNSEKICTLKKDTSVKVLEIDGDWCLISNIEMQGYVPSNCISSKNPNQIEEPSNELSKGELLAKLKFDMKLNERSGFSLEQFKNVLSSDSNDKKGVFEANAEYFYYAEEQYNINGIFVAAIGIHESGWGTSAIANSKKNLFGYGAVDSNPYGGAMSFENYAEGIDLISRVLVKYYINPAGTDIYDNNKASGKFYSGSTLDAVNSKYASDKNWAKSVYKWMTYLYNKL